MRDYSFGNFLYELRERRGLSQYQLGMLVGVSNKAVSKWENGSAKPQSRILYRLSEVLGVTVDELLACRYRSAENKDRKGVHAMKQEIWDKAYKELKYRYGEAFPVELGNRYFSEYEELKNTDEILYFELLGQINKMAESTGGHMRVNGSIGSSLAAYLLGASEVNPLKPHYYCPHCRKIQFDESVLCGWDLPEKKCTCGRTFLRDGHNLPFEALRPNLQRATRYDVFLSQNLYREAQEMIYRFFREDTVVALDKKDTSDAGTFVILDRQAVCAEPNIAEVVTDAAKDIGRGQPLPFEVFYDRFKRYPMITLVRSEELDKYRQLEEMTEISFAEVPFTDRKVLEAFCTRLLRTNVEGEADNREMDNYLDGIPEFSSAFVREMIRESAPKSFHDIIQIPGLAHGTGGWLDNGEQLIRNGMPPGRLLAWREDVFCYIQDKIGRKNETGTGYACHIMEEVRRGVYAREGIPAEIRKQLSELGAEEWFKESIEKIRYLFPRAHGVLRVKYALILMWYKIEYPEAFYQCGFCQRCSFI